MRAVNIMRHVEDPFPIRIKARKPQGILEVILLYLAKPNKVGMG